MTKRLPIASVETPPERRLRCGASGCHLPASAPSDWSTRAVRSRERARGLPVLGDSSMLTRVERSKTAELSSSRWLSRNLLHKVNDLQTNAVLAKRRTSADQ